MEAHEIPFQDVLCDQRNIVNAGPRQFFGEIGGQMGIFFNGNQMLDLSGKRQGEGPLAGADLQDRIRRPQTGPGNNPADHVGIRQEMLTESLPWPES